MSINELNNQVYWDNQWHEIFQHYQNDRRFAYYLRSIIEKADQNILEIGAGSFRDMQQLNQWGYNCTGTDFSNTAVNLAKQMYPELKRKIIESNAFELPFENNAFTLSYHNGFWVCFEDNDILKLVKEQARVTKNRIIATVHNGHNNSFKAYFDKLKKENQLYSCRFFEIDHITELMMTCCSKVQVIPVGKGKKHYEDYLINLGLGDPDSLQACWKYHKLDLLHDSERLLCIGTV